MPTQIKIKIDVDKGTVTWEGLDFSVNVPELLGITDWDEREELDRHATCHGVKQKVNDSRAGLTEAKGNTTDDMVAAMQEVVDHVANGTWNKAREGGKGKTVGLTAFVQKLKAAGSSLEEIRELAKTLFPTIDSNTINF